VPFAAVSPGNANLSGVFRKTKRTDKGTVLRKFALLVAACAALLFASLASAQQPQSAPPQQPAPQAQPAPPLQVDILVGGSILESATRTSDSVNFHPLTEKDGIYPSISVDFVGFKKTRLGFNVETSWRYHQGNYYGYENYRPIFTDVNAFFQPRLSKKLGLDLMAGVGVASNRFNILSSCGIPGCINYTSSTHFMEDLGGGFRYKVWHRLPHIFLRPEAHYYHIQNNLGFSSNNVFRVGASVGYAIGPD
jgi:hypothetical protein